MIKVSGVFGYAYHYEQTANIYITHHYKIVNFGSEASTLTKMIYFRFKGTIVLDIDELVSCV